MNHNIMNKMAITIIVAWLSFICVNALSYAEIVSGSAKSTDKIEINGKTISRTVIYEAGKSPTISDITVDGLPVNDTKIWLNNGKFIDLTDPDLKAQSRWVLYIKPAIIGGVILIIGVGIFLVMRWRSANKRIII